MNDPRNQILLTGQNYATWKVQCRMMLMKHGVWKIVDGTEVAPLPTRDNHAALTKFSDRRDKALSTIVLAVDPALLYLLGDPQDPVDVWKKLADQFQARTWANKLALRCKLHRLRLDESRPMQEHIKSMIEIFEELAVIGSPMEEEDRVAQILTSLPDSYSMLVTAFEASSEVPKLEIVTERLLNEERKIKDKRGPGGRGLTGEALFTNGSRQIKVCFYCGESGHIKRFCDKLKKDTENEERNKQPVAANFTSTRRNQRSDSESSEECIALVSKVSEEKKNKWYLDSAASRHLCKDRKLFQRVNKLRYPKSVKVGDGSTVKANYEGTIKLKVRSGSKVSKVKMVKVLYVPDLKYNLLSVSQATKCGKIIQFDQFEAKIKDISSGEVVCTAARIGELYEVNIDSEVRNQRQSNDSLNSKKMEKALLSVKENNFAEEIMKRLNKIEEDKLKMNDRLNTVEEDMNCATESYAVIKEDNQNHQARMTSLRNNTTLLIQEDTYCDEIEEIVSIDEEQEISIQEDMSDDEKDFEDEAMRCRQIFDSLSDYSICEEKEPSVMDCSDVQESSGIVCMNGKGRKLKKRLLALKNRCAKLFRK